MEIAKLVKSLENCPCGRAHTVNIRAVEIGAGLLRETPAILRRSGFPENILVVADRNTLSAADGIFDLLVRRGFCCRLKLYDNLREADITQVREIASLAAETEGILSVGTGSLNDICRMAALLSDKAFAIFATAPSMDGFASGTSPIIENGFKTTRPARQPSVIIGDTEILAASPPILKQAGFGDMIAKYVGLVDWKVSRLVTGEYYCDRIAAVTREALARVVSMADRVTRNDPETAGAIMEALVLTGLAMKLADSIRPASGTEHIISHFWEIKQLERGVTPDYHGRQVGVATLMAAKLYHELAAREDVRFTADKTDWDEVYRAYGPNFADDVRRLNTPTVTAETSPERVASSWPEIRRIVREELPAYDELLGLMKKAGAATTAAEIGVDETLAALGLRYHPYMRHRMTLMRLIPMIAES